MAKKQKLTADQKRVSTHLVYVDLKTIMENYRSPEFWGKKWLIYQSGNIKICWQMTNIDVVDNKINSAITVEPFIYKKKTVSFVWDNFFANNYRWSCHAIPINNPEYRQEVLSNNILSTALELLPSLESFITEKYAEYRQARILISEISDKIREKGEEVAESIVRGDKADGSLSKEEVEKYVDVGRTAILDEYIDDKTPNYTSDIKANYRYKILSPIYLGLCSWFGNETQFNKYKNLIGNKAKRHVWLKMFLKAKEIQTEEWENSMENELRRLLK